MTATIPDKPPTAPAAETPSAMLADLILVRLLPPAKNPPSPKAIRADLSAFFREPPTESRFEATIASLRHAGAIEAGRGTKITDAGRRRALAYLGISELPPRCNWGTIKAKFLLPRALGLDASQAKTLANGEKLGAFLLKRKLGLPVGTPTTFAGVAEAIACREAGFESCSTLKELRTAALNRAIESPIPLVEKQLKKQLPLAILGAKSGANGLRAVALTGWIDDRQEPDAARAIDESFDLEAFAHTVLAAARDCESGRFAGNMVFIHSVWNRLAGEPGFPRMDLTTFKLRLLEANAAGLLVLQRADIGQLANPDDLAASETHHLNATFHLVVAAQE